MIARSIILIVVLALARPAFAGVELIEIQMRSSQLAGSVMDQSGRVIEGVEMELHTCQVMKDGSMHMDEQVLARIKTDAEGRFAMARGLHPASACLRLDSNGFNPMLIGIKWSHFAAAMKITMHVAT